MSKMDHTCHDVDV